MASNNSAFLMLAIVIVCFASGFYFYGELPDKIAVHWNAHGLPNGYGEKTSGIFLAPIISAAVFILFMAIPKIDPLKKNISAFRAQFDGFAIIFLLFLLYMQLIIILFNLGTGFNMGQAIAPAIGALFFFCGTLLEKTKKNWFIGIRTPWTMESEKVWEKTHLLGGKLFKASGIIAIAGALAQDYAIFLVIVPVMVSAAWLVAYSYFEYQKETGHRRSE